MKLSDNSDYTEENYSHYELKGCENSVFPMTDFQDATLSGSFSECVFTFSLMEDAFFIEAKMDDCKFVHVDASGSRFEGTKFTDCEFVGGIFKDTLFIDCEFIGCTMAAWYARNARFQGCTFEESDISGCLIDVVFDDECLFDDETTINRIEEKIKNK